MPPDFYDNVTVMLHKKNGTILAHHVYRDSEVILDRLPDRIKLDGIWYTRVSDICYREEETE